jgi:hypothetical protein
MMLVYPVLWLSTLRLRCQVSTSFIEKFLTLIEKFLTISINALRTMGQDGSSKNLLFGYGRGLVWLLSITFKEIHRPNLSAL